MRRSELQDAYTLRRRRLFGFCILVAFAVASLAMNDWRPTPIWAVLEPDEGTFAAGDPFGEWIYGFCDGQQQQIIVSQNGKLAGAAALTSLRTVRFPDWCGLPTIDSPQLMEWRARAGRLEQLIETQPLAASAILRTAQEMPTSHLYLKPLSDWINANPAHAVAFLDGIAERPMGFDHPNAAIVRTRKENFSRLVDDALARAAASGELDPSKLDHWLGEPQVAGSGRSLRTLAAIDGVSDHAAAMMLERLETLRPSERDQLYSALAPRLAPESTHAVLLAKQLRLLPRESRALAAHQLLAEPEANIQIPIALLSSLRQTYSSPESRLHAFMAVADKLRHEAEAPLLLTRHLRDLPDVERRMAATYLVSLDEAGETAFTMGVLRALSDLHPMSRPKVLGAVMQSEQFGDRAVQEACLLAIRLETHAHEQHELLRAMLSHYELDSDLQSRIRATLGV